MKTAMQELIEYLESRYFKYEISSILLKSKDLLIKEKEQIENAYWDGGQDVPTNGDRCQEYYNQTYNQ
jgi:hypothetical protein